MSEENIEIVRAGYERFAATGEVGRDYTADFVWDVSNLHWPGQQLYEGAEGAQTFLRAVSYTHLTLPTNREV